MYLTSSTKKFTHIISGRVDRASATEVVDSGLMLYEAMKKPMKEDHLVENRPPEAILVICSKNCTDQWLSA